MVDYTTNYNLELIDFDTIPWHAKEHNNWLAIDAIFAHFITINNMRGVWLNALSVTVGQRFVDPEAGTIWTVAVAHTTASTGLFSADRTANESYWTLFSEVALAESWATSLAGLINATDYSSKAYAIGTVTQLPDGSAKRWAVEVEDTEVISGSYSALHHATKAAADAVLTAADVVSTNADVVSTNADVVSTGADVISTNADVVTTTQDAIDTAADVVSTNADVVTTAASAAAAAASAANMPDDADVDALEYLRRNAGDTAYEARTPAQVLTDISGIGAATTDTLTEKTIDANASGNVLSNIDIGNAIAASQAETEAGTDNTKLVTPLRVAQAIQNWAAPNENLIINGGFQANQRVYVSTTATADGVYMHDRWRSGSTDSSYTFSNASPASPQNVTIAANDSIEQVIEGANISTAGTHTISWDGTATARGVVNTQTMSGNFAVSPITVTAVKDQIITLQFTGADAAGGSTEATDTGTLGLVKCELGSVATAFVADDYSVLLAKCKRYYQRFISLGSCWAKNTSQVVCTMKMEPELRATGTGSLIDTTPTIANGNTSYTSSGTSYTNTAASSKSHSFYMGGFTSLTMWHSYQENQTTDIWQVSAEL
jgi:hypothetical protein